MQRLALNCPVEERERLAGILWDHGTSGIVERDASPERIELEAFFEDDVPREQLRELFAAYQPEWSEAESVDWVAATQEAWPAIAVGDTLFLVPEWSNAELPPGRIRVPTHPGMACGTGAHPATQLSLAALEQVIQPASVVLDVGTGSGLLSVAAVLLGAGRVCACDIDEAAVSVARGNFHADRVTVPHFTGSVDAVASATADVIVANINAPVAQKLATEWHRVLRPSGTLILSGFEESERHGVKQALTRAGLSIQGELADHNWVALLARR